MNSRALNILFGVTIFSGAFLLFQVQPLLGKYILPWFGGTPAVWTTCMLFFQVMLLVGYAYAHGSIQFLSPRGQMIFHLILLGLALLLPIIPASRWIPTDANNPAVRILTMLATSVGLPYLVLAATGPLLQSWFGRRWPGRSPYRLYALSNAASLLALLSYPFLIEPVLTRPAQALLWRCCLVGFAILCGAVTVISATPAPEPSPDDRIPESAALRKWSDVAFWLLLSACASALLLAITNKICQDVAVVPLLWVVPLAIYLLTFIISFDSPRWYRREIFVPLMGLTMFVTAGVLLRVDLRADHPISIVHQIIIYCALLFACCMVCHGELYRRRPEASQLTSYYMTIAFGGALGGALVAVAAPLLLKGYFEFHISLFAVGVLTLLALRKTIASKYPMMFGGMCLAAIALASVLVVNATAFLKDATVIDRNRNFYGVLTVLDILPQDSFSRHRLLQHGGVTHGVQFANPARRRLPITYYGPLSGVGVLFRTFPRHSPLRVGAIGLGVGTIATYGEEGDLFRFYEINPMVLNMAGAWFTFLFDSPAKTEEVFGDARISLQREAPQNFDVMVLDAFSGDAIPVHLLTKECFELYLRHLKADGIIAVHISNQNLNLFPVIKRAADHFGLRYVLVDSKERPADQQYVARWVLLTKNAQWIDSPAVQSVKSLVEPDQQSVRLWTDDDTNLFQILN